MIRRHADNMWCYQTNKAYCSPIEHIHLWRSRVMINVLTLFTFTPMFRAFLPNAKAFNSVQKNNHSAKDGQCCQKHQRIVKTAAGQAPLSRGNVFTLSGANVIRDKTRNKHGIYTIRMIVLVDNEKSILYAKLESR